MTDTSWPYEVKGCFVAAVFLHKADIQQTVCSFVMSAIVIWSLPVVEWYCMLVDGKRVASTTSS